jgi:hypothetical protein
MLVKHNILYNITYLRFFLTKIKFLKPFYSKTIYLDELAIKVNFLHF